MGNVLWKTRNKQGTLNRALASVLLTPPRPHSHHLTPVAGPPLFLMKSHRWHLFLQKENWKFIHKRTSSNSFHCGIWQTFSCSLYFKTIDILNQNPLSACTQAKGRSHETLQDSMLRQKEKSTAYTSIYMPLEPRPIGQFLCNNPVFMSSNHHHLSYFLEEKKKVQAWLGPKRIKMFSSITM